MNVNKYLNLLIKLLNYKKFALYNKKLLMLIQNKKIICNKNKIIVKTNKNKKKN